MKRVLITGAAGFIGYHLASGLLRVPETELILVDNLERGERDAAFRELLASPRVVFEQLDLTDAHACDRLPLVDEVYHLAAVNGTKRFYTMPVEVLRTNILSLMNMLTWVGAMARPAKFLWTSSNEAYAGALAAFAQLPLPTPEDVPLVIADPYNPRWSYGASKLVGELLVIHSARRHQMPAVIVRPHNFYGPRAGHDHVIPELLTRIRARQDPFDLYSPSETRSFCYITDAVDALIRSMAIASVEAPTLHVGSAIETSIEDLTSGLFAIEGWHPREIATHASPVGSVARRCPDVSKIRTLTGWETSTSLEEGLRHTAAWYAAAHV